MGVTGKAPLLFLLLQGVFIYPSWEGRPARERHSREGRPAVDHVGVRDSV